MTEKHSSFYPLGMIHISLIVQVIHRTCVIIRDNGRYSKWSFIICTIAKETETSAHSLHFVKIRQNSTSGSLFNS